jgi:chromate reductase
VIPEINRAVPALVTNAFTWASRPWGQSAWSGKPGAIVGTSPGVIGSAVAQSQLRGQMALFEIHLMGQPEVYFQTKPGLIDENFDVTDEKTRAFLQGWVAKFDRWIERVNAQEAVSVAAK